MNSPGLESPYLEMLDNYLLAKENRPESEKGLSWGVFPSDFEKAIADPSIWPTFMRNPLGVGLVSETLDFHNVSVLGPDHANISDPSLKRLAHDYSTLIDETIEDPDKQKVIISLVLSMIDLYGLEFLTEYYLLSDVGSPATFLATFTVPGIDPITIPVNETELTESYFFYQSARTLQACCNNDSPTVIDIGAGYGGLMAKMKKAFPGARCILLDLPEWLPVQTYYLNRIYPGKKFLYYRDWWEQGSSIFDEDFDFLIAPYWMIKDIPDVSVDQVINVRAMMEMTNAVVSFYFQEIQRITRVGGLFACFNRYSKVVSGEPTVLKHYPYDDYWHVLLSQTTRIYPHLHDLVVRRQVEKNPFPIVEAMKTFPAEVLPELS